MATANERLLDEAIRHAVELNKYSNHVVQRMIAVLNRADRRLFAELIEALSRLDPDSFTVQRLQDMLASVMQLNAAAFDAVQRELTQELRDFLVYAVDYERAMLVNAIPVRVPVATLAAEQVYAAAMARPFQGVLLREALKDVSAQRAKTIRQRLAQGFVEGRTIPDMVRELRGTRAKGYADGLLQRSRRDIEAITRTAVSHMAGFTRDRMMESNSDLIKATRWVSTLDTRTTLEICVPRDGKLYHPVTHRPMGHDLPWLGGAGRAHWNCLPGDAMVSSKTPIARAYKRPYKGDVLVIRTASGRELTCTPNHPVLSDAGWVPAQELNLGSNVVSYGACDGVSVSDAQNDDVPARIEDVAEAFFVASGVVTVEVPVSAPDFHGDAIGGEVAVVGADRSLWFSDDPAIKQHAGEQGFSRRSETALSDLRGLSGLGERLGRNGAACSGGIGGFYKGLPTGEVEAAHSGELLFAPAPGGDAVGFEYRGDSSGRNAKVVSDTAHADAVIEHGSGGVQVKTGDLCAVGGHINSEQSRSYPVLSHDARDDRVRHVKHASDLGDGIAGIVESLDFFDRKINCQAPGLNVIGLHDVADVAVSHAEHGADFLDGFPALVGGNDVGRNGVSVESHLLHSPSDADVSSDQGFLDHIERDAVIARQLLDGSAGPIFIDEIVRLERKAFSGHVFNLETIGGWYVADGIVTHNCRSTSVPVLKSWKELTGVDMPEFTPATRASMDGQVPATMDYETWLAKQSAARQDEILGPTRGRLLRQGGLSVKDMYSHKGRFLSLPELRERDAKAFQSAGL